MILQFLRKIKKPDKNMSYTENLENFENLRETDNCYLDGRYFNKVFIRYPGLLANPLVIKITETKRKDVKSYRHYIHMKETNIDTAMPGLLKLVIETPKTKHCNLLILDYENRNIYRFEPLGKKAPFYEDVNSIVEDYLNIYFGDMNLQLIDLDLGIMDQKNPRCQVSGFCNAYVIYYAYCYLNGKDFYEDINIRKFATLIEKTYGTLPKEGAEIEYGLFGNPNPDQNRNMAIGGLAGLGIGGLVGGVPGAALGGVTGLGIGALI